MAYSYLISPIAADEYEEAFTWYEERSVIAADSFIVAVQNAIQAACNDPYRYRNIYKTCVNLLKKNTYLI